MADDDAIKFALAQSDQNKVKFSFAGSSLNLSSSSPKDFIWNKTNTPVKILDKAQVFSELTEEYIGYDPLNRDRLEIRLYTAKIIPERVALGVGYGRLLASKWGALNFGEVTYDHDFGEVLGGDNSSGVMFVNRISVMRRGEQVLIIRSKFDADYFDQYKDAIATFVGSIELSNTSSKDPIVTSLEVAYLFKNDPEFKFKYYMPDNWEKVVPPDGRRDRMQFDFWNDLGDNLGNSGAHVFIIKPSGKTPKDLGPPPDPNRAENIAGYYAKTFIDNFAPDSQYRFTAVERSSLQKFEQITFYNELFKFSVDLELEDNQGTLPLIVSVMVTIGDDGTVNTSVVQTTEYSNDYRFGTKEHAEFTHQLLIDAQESYWKTRANQHH
ncbi:hypothetical protein SAMN04488518_102468 [Pseudovibrio ascidiaceicola]|uniref:Uncharacterized protein n=1 Tax=Pseudovibrio ascidiaceicola TaxID=285279 RepID=A0A1I3X9Y9_9HYPH|nr:hypothetical protein [Pseudovibrio ascidiaceicola]SFK16443.1 hypothetical protein SAMN04488518_102468 [Pseudovibrio ascidiaceicola]